MPPILIGFFILLGALSAPDLIKGFDPRPDGSSHSKFGKPERQAYRTWVSTLSQTKPSPSTCDVTYFAMATRNRIMRLRVGDEEQLLDFSWSFPRVLKAGEKRKVALEFLDPISGATASCQELTVFCEGNPVIDTSEGECRPEAKPPKEKSDKLSFVGEGRSMYMYNPAIGGAAATVSFVIRGKVNEAWYCPRLDVYWPDGTHTVRESDCEPFDETIEYELTRWSFTRGFPAGEWPVRACISKNSKILSCADVRVIVSGGGN